MDWRSEWFEFKDATYLNTAWQGPMPRSSVQAVLAALEWKKYPHKIPDSAYSELPDRTRALLARLIHGEPAEIALTTGASGGLAIVAEGLEWKPEDEVLTLRGDFIAHLATWGPLAEAGRLRLKIVSSPGKFVTTEDFLSQIGARTRLVSVSFVQPYDAVLLEAARLAEACHSVGALLLLDVSQCAGAMPLDVRALGADFLVCSGYKWLLGPYGTGFFWIRGDLIPQMRPGPVNWKALQTQAHLMERIRVAPSALRWDAPETASFFNVSAFACSIEFLLRAGVEAVWRHNRRLVAQMIEQLPLDHCILASPADPDGRGSFSCIAARSSEKTAALYQRLRAARINVSFRNGALRVAPHLYNTERDVDRLLTCVGE